MKYTSGRIWAFMLTLIILIASCKVPKMYQMNTQPLEAKIPSSIDNKFITPNVENLNWRKYFKDSLLVQLIDTMLTRNFELGIRHLEVDILGFEVKARQGDYLPYLGVKLGGGIEKEGNYTRHGAVDEQLNIKEHTPFPKPLGDLVIGPYARWEVDVWKKLRNAKKSAYLKLMAGKETRHFFQTELVAEIAELYYKLIMLDAQKSILQQNILTQQNALRAIRLQKEAAKETQLAVNRFEAQLLNTQNKQFEIQQNIQIIENKINLLLGRYPQPIARSTQLLNGSLMADLKEGLPSNILENRPDVQQAAYELQAAKLDVKVAKANFYPNIDLKAGLGLQAYQAKLWFNPASIFYNLVGDALTPLINKRAIKAAYNTANAVQIQKLLAYNQTILQAYMETSNALTKLDNYTKSYVVKQAEVEQLLQSINIANNLFNTARADYTEVLFTQREALEAQMELVYVQMEQLIARVDLYKALGGGWNGLVNE